MKYYDWKKTFSYQTGTQGEFCLVIGARGIGKTYGLRKQCVKDYLKDKSKFVEICRYSSELSLVASGYFDKLQLKNEFPNLEFKIEKQCAYVRELSLDEDNQNEWELIGYFVSLSSFQKDKKRTFANVKRIIFDEAILDRKDNHHRYLVNEFGILAQVINTLLREEIGEPTKGKIYLLGNACDLTAPYFFNLGINKAPNFGYSFYNDNATLLHYVEATEAAEKKRNTLVGRMLSGNSEAALIFDNKFINAHDEFIEQKTSNAKFTYGIKYRNMIFGIWLDYKTGMFYVTDRVPNNSDNIYALTKADTTINYQIVKKTNELLKIIIECFYIGAVRYSSPAVREAFLEVLSLFGIF